MGDASSSKDYGSAAVAKSDPYHVQFEKEGPIVYVKNTFLDFDQLPAPMPVTRGSTAPASVTYPTDVAIENPNTSAEFAESNALVSAAALHSGLSGLENCIAARNDQHWCEQPLTPQALIRSTTYDPFEQPQVWLPAAAEWSQYEASLRNFASASMMPPMATLPSVAELSQYETSLPDFGSASMMPPIATGAEVLVPMNFPGCSEPPVQPFNCGHVETTSAMVAEDSAGMKSRSDVDASGMMTSLTGTTSALSSTLEGTQPQTLAREMVSKTGPRRIFWTVDARKLNGSSRTAVSPRFEVVHGGLPAFKMMLSPQSTSDGTGGTSFKKSQGRGIIQLKCEADLQSSGCRLVTFRISVGKSREHIKNEVPRGPVSHDFIAKNGICGLPKHQALWDFSRLVDIDSQTFIVCLEII